MRNGVDPHQIEGILSGFDTESGNDVFSSMGLTGFSNKIPHVKERRKTGQELLPYGLDQKELNVDDEAFPLNLL
jgi:hypothetical protein